MNIHIELVKKWLADKDSVSQQELYDSIISAKAANDAADAYAAHTYAAHAAATCAANVLFAATITDAAHAAANADYWVNRYEELTK